MGDKKESFLADNRADEINAAVVKQSPVATVGSRPQRQLPTAVSATENLSGTVPAPVEPGTKTGVRFQAAVAAKNALADKTAEQPAEKGKEDFEAFRARLAKKASAG